MQAALEMINKGRSIVIFPEGGIKTKNPPFMIPRLKDGAAQNGHTYANTNHTNNFS